VLLDLLGAPDEMVPMVHQVPMEGQEQQVYPATQDVTVLLDQMARLEPMAGLAQLVQADLPVEMELLEEMEP
jgi:hypothetical protein